MAKYNVTYSCGHEGTETLFGPGRERERKLEWFREGGLCPTCYTEKKEADRQAAAVQAERAAASAGLPPLVGTEKQCAWAETIRMGFVAYLERAAGRLDDGRLPASVAGQVKALRENPADSASWAAFADAMSEAGAMGEPDLPALPAGRHGDRHGAAGRHGGRQGGHGAADEPDEIGLLDRARAVLHILGQVEARWWIDTRYRPSDALVEHVAREPGRLAAELARRQAEQQAAQDAERAREQQQRELWEKKDAVARRVSALLNPAPAEQRWKVAVRQLAHAKACLYFGPGSAGFASEIEAIEAGRAWAEGQGWTVSDVVALPIRPDRLVSEIQVWDRGDRRAYLGHGFDANCVTYYHTGTRHHRPGSLVLSTAAAAHLGARTEELRAFLSDVCAEWKTLHIVLAEDGSAAGN